ncbi:ogr/Delta-like zinc finger family protein [Laribacter hongkongensis]|nr:ogr/Delta-like zinc finger family protein [Laribacter hongkongensis]
MATKCAHCGSTANIRTSRMISTTLQEEYFVCSNVLCGHTFRAVREHIETLSPPALPNPAVRLPVANRRRLIECAMTMTDTDQLALELPAGQ